MSNSVSLGQGGLGAIITLPLYSTNYVPKTVEDRNLYADGAITSAFLLKDFFAPIFSGEIIDKQEISVSVTGRGGKVIPLVIKNVKEDYLTNFFGLINLEETVDLGTTKVTFIFTAPVISQLSTQEVLQPFLLMGIFFGAAVFMSVMIIVVQKFKNSADLKKSYEFITTLSHQLRTPLTNIRWQLEVGEGRVNKESQKLILDNVFVLNSIVERMLLYTGLISLGKKSDKKTSCVIGVIYKKALGQLSATRDISRVNNTGGDLMKLKIQIDEENAVLILVYVLENALTYSPKQSMVNVQFKLDDKLLNVIVDDKGFGIPEKEQNKVFNQFFRATNASRGINYGSGVSLFIAKNIIQRFGGNISFKSKENKGSTFTISYPLA